MSAMKRLFQIMADKKASDIFLSVGAPINIKINGVAMPVNQTVMTAETIQQLFSLPYDPKWARPEAGSGSPPPAPRF